MRRIEFGETPMGLWSAALAFEYSYSLRIEFDGMPDADHDACASHPGDLKCLRAPHHRPSLGPRIEDKSREL